jgi:hypothetical protein
MGATRIISTIISVRCSHSASKRWFCGPCLFEFTGELIDAGGTFVHEQFEPAHRPLPVFQFAAQEADGRF